MKVTRLQKSSTIKYRKGSQAKSGIQKGRVMARSHSRKTKGEPTPNTRSRRRDSVLQTKDSPPSKVSSSKNAQSESSTTKNHQIYDFDQSDEDGLKQVLFPEDENEENKVTGSKKYVSNTRKRKALVELEPEKKAKVSKRTLRSKDGNIKIMFEKLNNRKDVKQKDNEKRQNIAISKKDQNKEESQKPVLKSKRKIGENTKSVKKGSDIDGFVTPLPRSTRSRKAALDSAVSTTNDTLLDMSKAKSTPIPYEPPVMPSPMLSPVQKLSPIDFSPKKHKKVDTLLELSLADYKSPRPADRTYTGRGSIGRYPASPALMKETKRLTKPKKTKKEQRRQSSKYEDWAVRMSLELEEAESYELSVED